MSESTQPASSGTYFNDFEELLDEKARELEQAKRQQAVLKALREQMVKIDCDHGVGNLEVDGDIIKVAVDVETIEPQPVAQVVNNYNWNQKFELDYSHHHETLVFEMAADIDAVCGSVEVN